MELSNFVFAIDNNFICIRNIYTQYPYITVVHKCCHNPDTYIHIHMHLNFLSILFVMLAELVLLVDRSRRRLAVCYFTVVLAAVGSSCCYSVFLFVVSCRCYCCIIGAVIMTSQLFLRIGTRVSCIYCAVFGRKSYVQLANPQYVLRAFRRCRW